MNHLSHLLCIDCIQRIKSRWNYLYKTRRHAMAYHMKPEKFLVIMEDHTGLSAMELAIMLGQHNRVADHIRSLSSDMVQHLAGAKNMADVIDIPKIETRRGRQENRPWYTRFQKTNKR